MVAANILNKQSRTAHKGWSSSLGVGEVLTNPCGKKVSCCETKSKPRTWNDTLVHPKLRKKDMRFDQEVGCGGMV